MKIFISSLISGMQAERQAVRQAILDLGHQPVMAEDFRAQPRSSQIGAAGPTQAILRPTELESPALHDDILKAAMFDHPIFDKAAGSKGGLAGNALVVRQESGASVRLDAQVDLVLQLPVPRVSGAYMGTLIQEDFEALAALGLGYAAWLFDRVDPTQRLSHIVPVAAALGVSYQTWRTRAQQVASPNTHAMRMSSENPSPVHLTPAHRPRPALKQNARDLSVDLIALLRRQMRP